MNKIIEKYDTIIEELFGLMGVPIVYMLLCHLWVFAILWGAMIIIAYTIVKKEIKSIEESIKEEQNIVE